MPYVKREAFPGREYENAPWEDYIGLTPEQRLENQRQQQIARLNAEQRILIAEASFASPNKAVVQSSIHEITVQGVKVRFNSHGQIFGLDQFSDIADALMVENKINELIRCIERDTLPDEHRPQDTESPDALEWYGEFKRTRHEQENIESYTQKDLV